MAEAPIAPSSQRVSQRAGPRGARPSRRACRRWPEARLLRLFDRLRDRQRRQAPSRDPRRQEPQVHDPRGRSAALRRRLDRRSLRWGRPRCKSRRSSVIGGIPRPEARSTERRGTAREVFGETIARSKRQSESELIGRTRQVWQPRLGRDLSREDARQIAENVTGFFSVLAEWSRAEMPVPANDTGKPAASENGEVRHDR